MAAPLRAKKWATSITPAALEEEIGVPHSPLLM
jgi:hypothetical protein